MPVCDICNTSIEWEEGYILTTRQVATSESYWESALKGPWSYMQAMDPTGDSLAMLAQRQAAQSDGWLVCEGCSSKFSFDRAAAKSLAKQQLTKPPGSGPADVSQVAKAAANAWKKLYGSWPSSITVA